MWILWDNLTAAIIVATVILLLLVARQRMVEVNMEQTANLVIRTATDQFTEWLEDDLQLMAFVSEHAEGSPVEALDTTSYAVYEEGDTTTVRYVERLVFKANEQKVMYQMEDPTRRDVNGKSLVTFTFNRYVAPEGGTFGATPSGSINVPFSDFNVAFLDEQGVEITDLAANPIKSTRVRFAVVTPFDVSRNTIREVFYGSTLLVSH